MIWLAEQRVGDWVVVSEEDRSAVGYPDPCRGDRAGDIAHLFAAAPELLHCLKVIVGHAKGRGLEASLHLNEARAAIAKAEGF